MRGFEWKGMVLRADDSGLEDRRVFIIPYALSFFFFQAEDGIRDSTVTGVQTCALPILSRAAATTCVQRLETKGLVETTPDPEDDRGVRVTLTRRGLEVLLRAGQLERRLAARAIEGLPASSIARAVHLLEEFKQRLEEKQIGVVH